MPQTLYLDEDVSPRLAEHLGPHDPVRFQVILASEVARGASDADQLWHAAQAQATLVTCNIKDFVRLHRWGKTLQSWRLLTQRHGGVLAAQNALPVDALGKAIVRFLTQQPAPLLEDSMYVYRQGLWMRERG